ncbi:MAG TPA: hypothetical protein VH912_05900 [Streptosporangiaceae bacterium]|jgi:4'-phosphopantetheinyl transferase EntD
MHPYIAEQIVAERVKSRHEEAAAGRLARQAKKLLGLRHGPYVSGKGGSPLRYPSRPATA